MNGSKESQVHSNSFKASPLKKWFKLGKYRNLMILYGVAAVVLAPLAILHKTSEVEVNLKTSLVKFTISGASEDSLMNSIDIDSLTLLNFENVVLGDGTLELSPSFDSGTSNLWVPLGIHREMVIISGQDSASITLRDVSLKHFVIPEMAETILAMEKDEPNLLRIRVHGVGAKGKIQVDKTFALSCNGCELKSIPAHYDTPSKSLRITADRKHLISFKCRSDWSTLALELPLSTEVNNHNIYLENGVYFTRLEEGKHISTIIGNGGKIKFEELNDKELQIRAGDFVILEELRKFFIKSIQIDQGINIIFHGRLGKLKIGQTELGKNRLPTYLEWLHGRHTWKLYLSALAVLVSTFFTILKQQETLGGRNKE